MFKFYSKGSVLIILLVLLMASSLLASLIIQNIINKQKKIKLYIEYNIEQIHNV